MYRSTFGNNKQPCASACHNKNHLIRFGLLERREDWVDAREREQAQTPNESCTLKKGFTIVQRNVETKTKNTPKTYK